jgi:hypothetical protein
MYILLNKRGEKKTKKEILGQLEIKSNCMLSLDGRALQQHGTAVRPG